MATTLHHVGNSGGCSATLATSHDRKVTQRAQHVQVQLWSKKKTLPSTSTLSFPNDAVTHTQQNSHFKTSHAVKAYASVEGKLLPPATSSSLTAFDLAHTGCPYAHMRACISVPLDASLCFRTCWVLTHLCRTGYSCFVYASSRRRHMPCPCPHVDALPTPFLAFALGQHTLCSLALLVPPAFISVSFFFLLFLFAHSHFQVSLAPPATPAL